MNDQSNVGNDKVNDQSNVGNKKVNDQSNVGNENVHEQINVGAGQSNVGSGQSHVNPEQSNVGGEHSNVGVGTSAAAEEVWSDMGESDELVSLGSSDEENGGNKPRYPEYIAEKHKHNPQFEVGAVIWFC